MPAVLILLLAAIAMLPAADPPRVRPVAWAQPVIGAEGPGNWFQIAPELHRCEQPSGKEMRVLEAFGIKGVVNLREHHSDADEVRGTGLVLTEVQLDAGDLTYAQLVTALKALLAAPKPTVVHCWHGSDRTGAVVAAWRIAMQGWTPADALDELVNGGYGHHAMFANLRVLISGLDRAKLRQDLGLPPAP